MTTIAKIFNATISTIENLDAQSHILTFLQRRDIISMSQVNKEWSTIVEKKRRDIKRSLRLGYRNMFNEEWKVYDIKEIRKPFYQQNPIVELEFSERKSFNNLLSKRVILYKLIVPAVDMISAMADLKQALIKNYTEYHCDKIIYSKESYPVKYDLECVQRYYSDATIIRKETYKHKGQQENGQISLLSSETYDVIYNENKESHKPEVYKTRKEYSKDGKLSNIFKPFSYTELFENEKVSETNWSFRDDQRVSVEVEYYGNGNIKKSEIICHQITRPLEEEEIKGYIRYENLKQITYDMKHYHIDSRLIEHITETLTNDVKLKNSMKIVVDEINVPTTASDFKSILSDNLIKIPSSHRRLQGLAMLYEKNYHLISSNTNRDLQALRRYRTLTVDELKFILKRNNIKYTSKQLKNDLITLLLDNKIDENVKLTNE